MISHRRWTSVGVSPLGLGDSFTTFHYRKPLDLLNVVARSESSEGTQRFRAAIALGHYTQAAWHTYKRGVRLEDCMRPTEPEWLGLARS